MNVMIYSSVTWNQRIYLVIFIGDMSPMNILGGGGGSGRWAYVFIG
jgi:hypothetical protein